MVKSLYSIVVTFNGIEWIDKCLNSLINSKIPTEIVVVDNGSNDGTREYILEHFHSVHVLNNFANLGFGKANNLGIDFALRKSADYIFLLNQDAWIEFDTLDVLLQCITNNSNLGIVSPIHLNGKGKALDIYFRNYLRDSETITYLTNIILKSVPQLCYIKTSFVNAAAWLISRDCLIKTGGFDPIFFHYGEDRNYAQRVIFRGFEIGIVTRAFIFHDREKRILQAQSSNKIDFKKEWDNFLNHSCDLHRNNPGFFILKRFIRHLLMSIKHLFSVNFTLFSFDLFMMRKIGTSIFAIYNCRRRSKLNNNIFSI